MIMSNESFGFVTPAIPLSVAALPVVPSPMSPVLKSVLGEVGDSLSVVTGGKALCSLIEFAGYASKSLRFISLQIFLEQLQ